MELTKKQEKLIAIAIKETIVQYPNLQKGTNPYSPILDRIDRNEFGQDFDDLREIDIDEVWMDVDNDLETEIWIGLKKLKKAFENGKEQEVSLPQYQLQKFAGFEFEEWDFGGEILSLSTEEKEIVLEDEAGETIFSTQDGNIDPAALFETQK